MPEILHTLLVFVIIFVVVLALNVIPVFAPPTWTVLSLIQIRFSSNVVLLAIVGAVAATIGRMVLAKLSTLIVRQKILSQSTKQNIDALKARLERNQKLTFSIFLFYAFSPLPSNHLFIAYGLTGLELKPIAIPFLIGRTLSYGFWAFTASSVAQMLDYESINARSFFSYYLVASQLFGLLIIYVFTRIDWRRVFEARRLGWRR